MMKTALTRLCWRQPNGRRLLQQSHRWLGLLGAFWLALWFASGMVMHFVPFPALSLSERLSFALPLQSARLSLSQALASAGIANTGMASPQLQGPVTLWQRGDTPVYQFRLPSPDSHNSSQTVLLDANSGARLPAIDNEAQLRQLLLHYFSADSLQQSDIILLQHDQWTVAGSLDGQRPLWRLQQPDGRWWYFSAQTGALVRDVSRHERLWNYAGAVLHWVYFTPLRQHPVLWREALWLLSLLCLLAALSGCWLGLQRLGLRTRNAVTVSPYRGIRRWHHLAGLGCSLFILSYLFSGWLSLDAGRLFRQVAPLDSQSALQGGVFQSQLFDSPSPMLQQNAATGAWAVREIQLLQLNQQAHWRLLGQGATGEVQQLLLDPHGNTQPYLPLPVVEAASAALAQLYDCEALVQVAADDWYRVNGALAQQPVYRRHCHIDQTELQFDSATGALVSNTNAPQRAYRWCYQLLHTLDLPALLARPWLRSSLTLLMGIAGLLFSLTAVLLTLKRLRGRCQ